MFYYLEGVVAHTEPYLAVIDCEGVGYACKTTNTTLRQLQRNQKKRLYTHLNVGEGVFELYGFATQGELGSFRQLLSVSGVGPKVALAILSSVSPEGLAMAVVTGDERTLTSAQGVGKKIAQRIILELKDKLAKEQVSGIAASDTMPATAGSKAVEAAQALSVLGYSSADVATAMKGLDTEALSLEEIVRQALKRMAK